jgi:hypothetical protein
MISPDYYERYRDQWVRIGKICYNVKEVTPEGIMKCIELRPDGYPKNQFSITTFDLTKMESHNLCTIGTQPGWDIHIKDRL